MQIKKTTRIISFGFSLLGLVLSSTSAAALSPTAQSSTTHLATATTQTSGITGISGQMNSFTGTLKSGQTVWKYIYVKGPHGSEVMVGQELTSATTTSKVFELDSTHPNSPTILGTQAHYYWETYTTTGGNNWEIASSPDGATFTNKLKVNLGVYGPYTYGVAEQVTDSTGTLPTFSASNVNGIQLWQNNNWIYWSTKTTEQTLTQALPYRISVVNAQIPNDVSHLKLQ